MLPFTRVTSSDHYSLAKSPAFVKFTAFTLLSLSIFFLVRYFSDPFPKLSSSFSNLTTTNSSANTYQPSVSPPPLPTVSLPSVAPPARPARDFLERTGIIDENGVMVLDFIVGDYDESLLGTVVNASWGVGGADRDEARGFVKGKIGKFGVCDQSMSQYIPCLDNMQPLSQLNLSGRHCPERGNGLDCVVPRPKGYTLRVPWPKSRDEVWYSNIPHTSLVDDNGGQILVSKKEKKYIFPERGMKQYLDQISTMVPEISFGKKTRIVLDIDCGVGSFGAYLAKRNVVTLSISPRKDANANQIQFALERGVSAMIAGLETRRLMFPSQAFELIHCSRCRVNWTDNGGVLLLEVNRLMRAGGYFVLALQQPADMPDKLEKGQLLHLHYVAPMMTQIMSGM
ncbi:unnamed protein product [Cuscuta europaea]|uniref:Methyltransferase n=1 Tax=Cuscuta europaea TaxID=41803 RepID=A0A9P0ZJ22_CUSEU|nr:unnamed protein product [Cuscuta europaea]